MVNGIKSVKQFMSLWTKTYNTNGKPDWSHILPYYSYDVYFRDSIQEIRGIADFKEMVQRLVERSNDLEMKIVNIVKKGRIILFEWEMKLSFGKYPSSILYGCSRITLNSKGLIAEQRDYYDLWGDIFDNIPWLAKRYRNFMRKKFG